MQGTPGCSFCLKYRLTALQALELRFEFLDRAVPIPAAHRLIDVRRRIPHQPAQFGPARLICLIGVAVVKPAEFVIFRIGQKTADAKS